MLIFLWKIRIHQQFVGNLHRKGIFLHNTLCQFFIQTIIKTCRLCIFQCNKVDLRWRKHLSSTMHAWHFISSYMLTMMSLVFHAIHEIIKIRDEMRRMRTIVSKLRSFDRIWRIDVYPSRLKVTIKMRLKISNYRHYKHDKTLHR